MPSADNAPAEDEATPACVHRRLGVCLRLRYPFAHRVVDRITAFVGLPPAAGSMPAYRGCHETHRRDVLQQRNHTGRATGHFTPDGWKALFSPCSQLQSCAVFGFGSTSHCSGCPGRRRTSSVKQAPVAQVDRASAS